MTDIYVASHRAPYSQYPLLIGPEYKVRYKVFVHVENLRVFCTKLCYVTPNKIQLTTDLEPAVDGLDPVEG